MKERDIIIRPLLSEKSYADIATKKYVFVVDKNSNKTEIKLAIEKLFDVQVESVMHEAEFQFFLFPACSVIIEGGILFGRVFPEHIKEAPHAIYHYIEGTLVAGEDQQAHAGHQNANSEEGIAQDMKYLNRLCLGKEVLGYKDAGYTQKANKQCDQILPKFSHFAVLLYSSR